MTALLTPLNRSVILVALFIMATGNFALFRQILQVYPLSLERLPFLLSLTAFFSFATLLLLLLTSFGRAARWVLAFFLIAAAQAGYYMDQYGVVIDTVMFDNIAHTDAQEISGLVSTGLILKTLLLGVLPAALVLKYLPKPLSLGAELKSKAILLVLLPVAMLLVAFPFSAGYASFIREHKTIRQFANPTFFTYSAYRYLQDQFRSSAPTALRPTAPDARAIGPADKKELIILVVGETARADRFSLNGYGRETNPQLRQRNVLSLTNVSSCATSTGESVPCMFSALTREKFDKDTALGIENALDVLHRHGVQVLWRDNNSDSKGVATRMQYESYRTGEKNPVCDPECRDVGMLDGLEKYIQANKDRDMLIVLHQMGNHGPEYYKRYPKEFEKFTPTCKSNELSSCSKQEIDNAYDNAILYTDHFLARAIDLLKKYDGAYETALVYVSDHGESLGENGIYLHSAPYLFAPKAQTHVPAIVWLGQHFDYGMAQLTPHRDDPLSHDDLFCALLAGFEIDTEVCSAKRAVLFSNTHFSPGPGKK